MMWICVNFNTPLFKEIASEYGAANEITGIAINKFLNNYLPDGAEFGSKQYNDFLDNYRDHPDFKPFMDHFFKKGTNNVFLSKILYNEALEAWNDYVPLLKDSYDSVEQANKVKYGTEELHGLNDLFGEENVLVYQNDQGGYSINVAQPMLNVKEFIPKVKEADVYEQSHLIVESLKHLSDERVKFDEDTHTYNIDGTVADVSVTGLDGAKDYGVWGIPSSSIGNSADAAVRNFFNNNDKIVGEIPNMSKTDIIQLESDLKRFRKYLDSIHGGEGNYTVVTDEIRIFSKVLKQNADGTIDDYVVAGTMDMLVYDRNGNFYIYDMKSSRSDTHRQKMPGYYKQLHRYKSILESMHPELKGRIKGLKVIGLRTSYPDARNSENVYRDGDPTKGENPKQLYLNDRPIQDYGEDVRDSSVVGDYMAPMLALDSEIESYIFEKEQGIDYTSHLKETFYKLDQDTKNLIGGENPTFIDENKSKLKAELNESNDKKIARELRLALNDRGLIGALDKSFLASTIMKYASLMVTHLQNESSAAILYLPKNKYNFIDFTSMSRNEIFQTLDIHDIFNYIKENFFDPNARLARGEHLSLSALADLKLFYDNWGAALEAGNRTLMNLEHRTIDKISDVILELGDPNINEIFDVATIEESIKEAWQQGTKHLSARAGLAQEIRMMFERLLNTDAHGNVIMNEKYNMQTFVDGASAVNQVFKWTEGATNLNEMVLRLQEHVKTHPWVEQILQDIREDSDIASKFFRNFRKDHLIYGVILPGFDSDGNRVLRTHIINTMGGSESIMRVMENRFLDGLVGSLIKTNKNFLDGTGKVLKASVESIKKAALDLYLELNSLHGKKFQDALKKNAPRIGKMLDIIGLNIKPETLNAFIEADLKHSRLGQSQTNTLFNQVNLITDTLLKNADLDQYNPLDSDDGVKSNYKKIADLLGKHIEESIEASSFENGKTYYSFVTPSYMGKLMSRLSNAMELDNASYQDFLFREYGTRWFQEDGKWKTPWLQMLNDAPSLRSEFQHKVQLNYLGTDYRNLSEMGYALSLMSEFFYDSNEKSAWYAMPINSDKPSSDFVKFRRFRGDMGKRRITNYLENVFDQERLRMKTTLEMAANRVADLNNVEPIENMDASEILSRPENKPLLGKLLSGEDITHSDLVRDGELIFKGTGVEFKFLHMFNQDIIDNNYLGELIIGDLNGTLSGNQKIELTNLYTEAFPEYMEAIFQNEKAIYEELGLYDFRESVNKDNEKVVSLQHLNSFIKGKKSYPDTAANRQTLIGKADTAIRDYLWNSYFATVNIILLTVTDLAFSKDMEDFQKRYSQVHSPTERLNLEATFLSKKGPIRYSDGISRTIYLKDFNVTSKILPQLESIFLRKVNQGEMTKNQMNNILAQYGKHNTVIDGRKYLKYMEDGHEILIPSGEINVTDGQGYSSLTSYRKKMGMGGYWNMAQERAYEIIRDPNSKWQGQDLDVIWQPLKGFVFTHTTKATGAKSMAELKIPTQHKNSEYLLLMADAIIRGDEVGSQNKNILNAIYDFMEESAYTNGVYNQKGIDTIQYESAVKLGLSGAIDLNLAQSYQEALDMLREAAYKSLDARNPDNYNAQLVHEFPFEDYGIQQNVPANMVDGTALQGSQMRVLTISDLNPSSVYNLRNESIIGLKLMNEYQSLIAKNILESYHELMNDLLVEDNTLNLAERNHKLSELLQREVMKDQRYSQDLMNALDVIDGKFVIPLSESIHSTRIQQLLNSIIKLRIVKQLVKGGSAVQVTVNGLSRDLNIAFKDTQGNQLMTRSEYKGSEREYRNYVLENAYSISHYEALLPVPTTEMENALRKEDGTLMSIEEALANNIITEEQLKAIGYRIPTEDKYSIFPIKIVGFVPKQAGEAIILPQDVTLIAGLDFDIDKIYLSFKNFRQVDIKGKNVVESFLEAGDQLIGKKEKLSFQENTNLKSKEGRDNRIFDLQWAALTHLDTMDKMFNPGSFDPLKKTSRVILTLKNADNTLSQSELSLMNLQLLEGMVEKGDYRNIAIPSNQIYYHKQNMTANKTIGIFANHNISHAFISMLDIYLNMEADETFYFDGLRVGNVGISKLDNQLALDGINRISKNIANYLAASVDGAKDPVLNFMNINTFTANTAMLLTRLGFDDMSIGLFLTQPIVEKVTREYFKANNEGYMSGDIIIRNELDRLSEKGYLGKREDLSNPANSFTKEWLAKNISDNAKGILIDGNKQVQTLLLFQELLLKAQYLNDLTKLTRYNSPTIQPSTIAEALVLKQQYNKFMEMMDDKSAPFSLSAKDVIKNSPILNAFYEGTIGDNGAQARIFKPYFPHYSPQFEILLNKLTDGMNSNIDAQTIEKLVNFYSLYKLNRETTNHYGLVIADAVIESTPENRDYYLNHFPRVFEKMVLGLVNNELINILHITPASEKIPMRTINASVANLSAEAKQRLSDAWSDLITHPDAQLRQLGKDLVIYNIHRSGLSFNPLTFLHLLSVDGKLAIDGYVDSFQDVNYQIEQDFDTDEMIHSFKRNFAHDRRIVPVFKLHEKITVSEGITFVDNKKVNTYSFFFDNNPKLMGQLRIAPTSTSLNAKFADYIWYNDKLLTKTLESSVDVTYRETSRLGLPHNAIEIDPKLKASTMESVIAKSELSSDEYIRDNSTELYDFTNEMYADENLVNLRNLAEQRLENQLYREMLEGNYMTAQQIEALRQQEGIRERRIKLQELIDTLNLERSEKMRLNEIIKIIC